MWRRINKVTRKDNPKRVYALFSDNPTAKFEDTHSGVFPDNIIKFKETISANSINGVDQAAGNTAFVRADGEPKMSAVAKTSRIERSYAQPENLQYDNAISWRCFSC